MASEFRGLVLVDLLGCSFWPGPYQPGEPWTLLCSRAAVMLLPLMPLVLLVGPKPLNPEPSRSWPLALLPVDDYCHRLLLPGLLRKSLVLLSL